MNTFEEQDVVVAGPPRSPIRWGALFGGLVVLTALGWLLMLLGSALGFTIADSTDLEAMGDGLGLGTTLWMVVSWLIAYFVGALVTARLAGSPESDVGMLHGLTLWGLASTVALALGTVGVTGLLSSGTTVIQQGSSAAQSAAVASTLLGGGDVDLESGELGPLVRQASRRVEVVIKREASELLAAEFEGSEAEFAKAIEQLDTDTLREAASEMIAGRPEGAKDVVARDTSLSEAQIDTLVASASRKVEQQVNELRAEVAAAAETAADYVETVLWIAFLAGAVALAACLGGGVLGACSVDRIVATRAVAHSTTVTSD